MEEKKQAYKLLRAMEEYFNEKLPGPDQISNAIQGFVKSARATKHGKYSGPEGAFVLEYVLPRMKIFWLIVWEWTIKRQKMHYLQRTTGISGIFLLARPREPHGILLKRL